MIQDQPDADGSLAADGSSEDEFIACLGKKWRLRVLSCLAEQPHRFNSIQRQLPGLSAHILTKTLRELERDGLVLRILKPTRPPTVEYKMSGLGDDMLDALTPLIEWLSLHSDKINQSRMRFDDEESSHHEADA